jgi:hypothetical protein
MEFKGTKGKWVVKRAKRTFPSCTKWQIINEDEDSLFEVELAESDEAMEANALLISKAPEMLQMLNWFAENLDHIFNAGTEAEKRVIATQKLIKEATEL